MARKDQANRSSIADALRGSLSPSLESLNEETSVPDEEESLAKPTTTKAKSRRGRQQLGFFVEKEVVRQMKVLAAENDTSQQALLVEAINLLFERYGKNPIAS